MHQMRDITPYEQPEPRPDTAPRPRGGRLWGAATRRRFAAASLAVLLVVAALVATVGTVVATARGAANWDMGIPFSSLAATISEAYNRIWGAAGSTIQLVGTGREILAILPAIANGERGAEFLALLEKAEGQLRNLGSSKLVPEFGSRADDLARGVAGVRAWLGEERRVAVVFGNSAEMRAGGGFIGSYAEVTLSGGAVSGTVVRDINEADYGSGDRTVPPIPLEPIAERWRAADANWFLSGPASGAAFLDLLNRSPLYREKPVDAVVFLSPRLVSDLLQVTGPITAANVAIDSANFLRAIQEEVQEGQAAGDEAPKAVLAELVPLFSSKLISSASSAPVEIFGIVQGAFSRRDIIIYAADPELQRVIEAVGVSGSLYPTDERYLGGYAAVAPSTIGGDKTDAVTDQAIRVREQILPGGLVETTVEVERTHRGLATDPWWYQEEHRSYVKVYAPLEATPTGSAGTWNRERARVTYPSSFGTYEPLEAVESTIQSVPSVRGIETFVETGKRVFGFWQRTARGQGTVASVTYAHQLPRDLGDGDAYTFVLERQPGSTSTYLVELFAPPGLVWEETGTTRYVFESADPMGRTVLSPKLVSAL